MYVLLSVAVLIFAIAFTTLWQVSFKRYSPDIKGDVLFVFAHPDDEAMFFSPLLMYLKRINVRAHFLCISNGNFAGLGLTREKELVASASYYGIGSEERQRYMLNQWLALQQQAKLTSKPPSAADLEKFKYFFPNDVIRGGSVTTINDERLPDGMKAYWDSNLIAQLIRHKVTSINGGGGGGGGSSSGSGVGIRTIVTFDSQGVSSHPNHIATFEGVKLFAKQLAAAAEAEAEAMSQTRDRGGEKKDENTAVEREGEEKGPEGGNTSSSATIKPILFLQLHTRSLLAKYLGPLALIPYFFGEGTVHPHSFQLSSSQKRRDIRKANKEMAKGGADTLLEGGEEGDKVGGDDGENDNDRTADDGYEVGVDDRGLRRRNKKNAASSSSSTSSSSSASSSLKRRVSKYTGGTYGLPWAIVIKPSQCLSSLDGLRRHASQLMWFRYLFVFFSTYGYVNEYEMIEY